MCSNLLEADICLEGRRLLRLASEVLLDLENSQQLINLQRNWQEIHIKDQEIGEKLTF